MEFQKFLLQFKNQVWEQNCVSPFYYFNFERSFDDALKVKESMHFIEQKKYKLW